jgi:hypothetical protein
MPKESREDGEKFHSVLVALQLADEFSAAGSQAATSHSPSRTSTPSLPAPSNQGDNRHAPANTPGIGMVSQALH